MSGLLPTPATGPASALLAHPGDRDNRLRRFAIHITTALRFGRQLADRRQALIDG